MKAYHTGLLAEMLKMNMSEGRATDVRNIEVHEEESKAFMRVQIATEWPRWEHKPSRPPAVNAGSDRRQVLQEQLDAGGLSDGELTKLQNELAQLQEAEAAEAVKAAASNDDSDSDAESDEELVEPPTVYYQYYDDAQGRVVATSKLTMIEFADRVPREASGEIQNKTKLFSHHDGKYTKAIILGSIKRRNGMAWINQAPECLLKDCLGLQSSKRSSTERGLRGKSVTSSSSRT